MVAGYVRRRFPSLPLRDIALRYVATLATVAAMTVIVRRAPVEGPLVQITWFSVLVVGAWVGGVGPSLLMSPLLLLLSRVVPEEPLESMVPSTQELVAFAIVGAIIVAFGLAGQYRRRIFTVTAQHAQKLRDQARALSLAHIVFREVDGRITEWNEGAELMFGWTSAEVIGRDLHDLLQTVFPCSRAEAHEELLRDGQWHGEVVHRRKGGAQLIIATHWILYRDTQGRPIGVAEVHNDISDLRRAEESVRAADRRKDEFLAMLAHELRNPLAPIRTGLELMRMAGDDPDTLEKTRSIMERQTQQLARLVDDLLDVSRIARGKLEFRRRTVKLSDVAQSAVEASRPFIDEAGHELILEVPEQTLYVDADPNRLAQVVSNLLNNAAKYTPKGGQIRLAIERQGSDALLTITDTGIGIPADMQVRIFEIFAQIEHRIEQEHAGLGIGLALAKALVEMHGGRIEVSSEGENRGSTFRVRLPILVERPPVEVQPVAPGPPGPTLDRRVLVVDDNQAAADMLSMMVRKLGNEVRIARDGREATRVASDFRPQVVLMDLGMPVMNGFEAAHYIREQPWGKDILLIALTGWGQEEDKQRAKEAGFDYHLVKPAEPADLRRLLAHGGRGAVAASQPA
jgi:PAS domain S-box-containing protein